MQKCALDLSEALSTINPEMHNHALRIQSSTFDVVFGRIDIRYRYNCRVLRIACHVLPLGADIKLGRPSFQQARISPSLLDA